MYYFQIIQQYIIILATMIALGHWYTTIEAQVYQPNCQPNLDRPVVANSGFQGASLECNRESSRMVMEIDNKLSEHKLLYTAGQLLVL